MLTEYFFNDYTVTDCVASVKFFISKHFESQDLLLLGIKINVKGPFCYKRVHGLKLKLFIPGV